MNDYVFDQGNVKLINTAISQYDVIKELQKMSQKVFVIDDDLKCDLWNYFKQEGLYSEAQLKRLGIMLQSDWL